MSGTHAGLEQLRSELYMAENTLRRVMEDTELLRLCGPGAMTFAGIWRGLKSAQGDVDFLRAILPERPR